MRTRTFSAGRLREERESAGLSQAQLAALVGCQTRQYQRYECGENLPTANRLAALADILRVDIDRLYATPLPSES